MFEKEAEEYTKGLCKTCTLDSCRYNTLKTCAIKESLKSGYQQGAEFGYNKAKEEMQEQIEKMKSDVEGLAKWKN